VITIRLAMTDTERPMAAFILSIAAGILIVIGSVVMVLMMSFGYWWMGMSDGHYSMMGLTTINTGNLFILLLLGAFCGVIIIISSILMYLRPKRARTWGWLILLFSLLSLFEMGGFFVGAILGILGGYLAITWQGSRRGLEKRTS